MEKRTVARGCDAEAAFGVICDCASGDTVGSRRAVVIVQQALYKKLGNYILGYKTVAR